ncbi:hypothetical protein K439DRAFT_1617329 [Ramaria rubella]|nr:hypothetical protein K439DRAFT_1617329 [Ramaria rubella]
MADTPGTIAEQQARLDDSLRKLKAKVLGFPKTLLNGTPEGPIAQYFCDLDYDQEDGPYETIHCAWTQTFKPDLKDTEWEALVLGVPHMDHNGLNVLYLRSQQLLDLIEKVSSGQITPGSRFILWILEDVTGQDKANSEARKTPKPRKVSTQTMAVSRKWKQDKDASNTSDDNEDFVPGLTSETDSEPEECDEQEGANLTPSAVKQKQAATPDSVPVSFEDETPKSSKMAVKKKIKSVSGIQSLRPPKKKAKIDKWLAQGKKMKDATCGSTGDESESGSGSEVHAGRKGNKADWVFLQFTPTPGHDAKGQVVDLDVQLVPCCAMFAPHGWLQAFEKLPCPPSSNFISHLDGKTP